MDPVTSSFGDACVMGRLDEARRLRDQVKEPERALSQVLRLFGEGIDLRFLGDVAELVLDHADMSQDRRCEILQQLVKEHLLYSCSITTTIAKRGKLYPQTMLQIALWIAENLKRTIENSVA